MCDVLVVIDNRFREMVPSFLIRHYLRQQGLTCAFCSRFSMWGAFNRLRPRAVILPNPGEPYIAELIKRAFVFILPSESGNGQTGSILAFFKGNVHYQTYSQQADRIFSWGPLMTDILRDNHIAAKEKIIMTGNPITDQWFIKPRPKKNKILGLTTTFRVINSSLGPVKNIFRAMREHENEGAGVYFMPPRHMETWFFYELSYVRLLANLIDQVVIGRDIHLEIRPHPSEKAEQYDYYRQVTGGRCCAVKSGSIVEWLQGIDVLATYLSTSAIDAIVRGIPVVSFKKLLNPDALAMMPAHYDLDYNGWLWQPATLEEFTEMVAAGFAGKLEITPFKTQFLKSIFDKFYFPRPRLASQNIAEEIAVFLGRETPRPFSYLPARNPQGIKKIAHRVLPHIPYSENAYLLLYSLQNFLEKDPISGAVGISYFPWAWESLLTAGRTSRQIIEAAA
ncbi:MAG: hypothetical protein HQL23_01030 [Candidatus Omnitrophica bacterium]|nr:hypothetical protein [Candidatus Omnitrophota bacterium]